MNDPVKSQNAAQNNAQKYFRKTAQDETLAKETRKKIRAAGTAKMDKLRALRLAKEAMDKEEADRLAAQPGAHPAPRKRASANKPAKLVRMSY